MVAAASYWLLAASSNLIPFQSESFTAKDAKESEGLPLMSRLARTMNTNLLLVIGKVIYLGNSLRSLLPIPLRPLR